MLSCLALAVAAAASIVSPGGYIAAVGATIVCCRNTGRPPSTAAPGARAPHDAPACRWTASHPYLLLALLQGEGSGALRLYKAVDFPLRWEQSSMLFIRGL